MLSELRAAPHYQQGNAFGMLSNAARRLFGFPGRGSRDGTGTTASGVFLLGTEKYVYEVTQVLIEDRELFEFLERVHDNEYSGFCIATLDFDPASQTSAGRVPVMIDRRRVGTCPSLLSTQIRKWLDRWGYKNLQVSCRARVVHRHGVQSTSATRCLVKLDIAVPFRMTTY